MEVTAVVNQKGGVGKSATTLNLSAALAEQGRRVLMVDLDPQGHLTRALGAEDASAEANLAKALLGQWSGELSELITPYRDNLSLVATSQDMFLLEPQMYSKTGREYLLSLLLDAMRPAFDHCLIDCPPSLGALTDDALVAARSDDERRIGTVMIPVEAEDSSLDALRLLLRQINTLQQVLGIRVKIAGLVVNKYDARRGNVATSTLDAYKAHKTLDVLAIIKDRKEIREGWRLHQPVVEHAPTSDAAGWYRDLAKEIVARGRR